MLAYLPIKAKLKLGARSEFTHFAQLTTTFNAYLDELYKHCSRLGCNILDDSILQQFGVQCSLFVELFQEHFNDEYLKNNLRLAPAVLELLKGCTSKIAKIAKLFKNSPRSEDIKVHATIALHLLHYYGEQHALYQHLDKPELALFAANKMLDFASFCHEVAKDQVPHQFAHYKDPTIVTKEAKIDEIYHFVYSSLSNYYFNLGYYGKGVEYIIKATCLTLSEIDPNTHINLSSYISNLCISRRWNLAYRLQKFQLERLTDAALEKLIPQAKQYLTNMRAQGQRKLALIKEMVDQEFRTLTLARVKMFRQFGILFCDWKMPLNFSQDKVLKLLQEAGVNGGFNADLHLVITDYYQYSPRKLSKVLQKLDDMLTNPEQDSIANLTAALQASRLTDTAIPLSGPEMKKGIYMIRPIAQGIFPKELNATDVERLQALLREGKIVNKRYPGIHIARRRSNDQDRLQLCLKTPEIPYKVEIEPVGTTKDAKGRTKVIFEATRCIKKNRVR